MRMKSIKQKNAGFGLGLRPDHYQSVLSEPVAVDWFEIITENYLVPGGKPLYYLDKIRERFPLAMHGVSLSIGSVDPLDMQYLAEVKALRDRVQPMWMSDHLCWIGAHSLNMHDLLPLPYTEEAVQHVVERIRKVQDFMGERLLIENVSSYVTYQQSDMSEWDFLSEIAERSDCLILLDVNNVYVSSVNHGFDPLTYIKKIPKQRVKQIHIAGHSDMGGFIIDTHDHAVVDPVWHLYEATLRYHGMVATMIERDDNIPPLGELVKELNQAKRIAQRVFETEVA